MDLRCVSCKQPREVCSCLTTEELDVDIWEVLRSRGFNPIHSLPTAMISRIEDIGRARQAMYAILDNELFEHRSKHDPFWESETLQDMDKLQNVRMKLSFMYDSLCEVLEILNNDQD